MVPSDGILVKGVDLQSKYNFELDEETGRLTGLINEARSPSIVLDRRLVLYPS